MTPCSASSGSWKGSTTDSGEKAPLHRGALPHTSADRLQARMVLHLRSLWRTWETRFSGSFAMGSAFVLTSCNAFGCLLEVTQGGIRSRSRR